MKRSIKGQFIKGSNGNTFDGFGIWYDKKDYPCIWINAKTIKLHVYIWERKYGNKPKGYELHHKDFNKKNYSLNNLELLTLSDHRKINARWIRKNGKWILKPCKGCKKNLPLDRFYPRKGFTPSSMCKECSVLYFKKRNTPKYKAKRKIYMQNYYKEHK